MIEKKSGYFLSLCKDETSHKLYYNLFSPKNNSDVKGTILILHGMKEHSGRYEDFAYFLSNNGYVVLTYDHLGHGKTAERNNQFGYFSKKQSKNQLIIDAENLAIFLENKYPFLPHFIIGHSMGSFITRNLLQVANQKFDGAVLVGSGDKITGINLAQSIFYLLNKIAPKHKNKLINNLFSKISNHHFRNEKDYQNTNWLSKNIENRINFINDEYCGIDFTINGFYTLIATVNHATKKKWSSKITKKFPMLFISGENDPIGNFGKGIKNTVNQLNKNNFSNIKMVLFSNMRHEILNESDKKLVYEEILKWISINANPS